MTSLDLIFASHITNLELKNTANCKPDMTTSKGKKEPTKPFNQRTRKGAELRKEQPSKSENFQTITTLLQPNTVKKYPHLQTKSKG